MHDITRYYTIFTISNGVAKTPRDNYSLTAIVSIYKKLCDAGLFVFLSTSVIAILKSLLISTFTSSKNTKPRWLNLSSTIIKRRESTSSLVSEQVQIAPRAFCEKQNEVRSTTSAEVKLTSSICFNQKGLFNL